MSFKFAKTSVFPSIIEVTRHCKGWIGASISFQTVFFVGVSIEKSEFTFLPAAVTWYFLAFWVVSRVHSE